MSVELWCCTQVLIDEIANKKMYQRDIAKTYSLALRSSYPTDWAKVNEAIITRWSLSGLDIIKNMAWSGRCWG
jgi:hypothetical protein